MTILEFWNCPRCKSINIDYEICYWTDLLEEAKRYYDPEDFPRGSYYCLDCDDEWFGKRIS